MTFPGMFKRIISAGLGLIDCHSKQNEQWKCYSHVLKRAGCVIV